MGFLKLFFIGILLQIITNLFVFPINVEAKEQSGDDRGRVIRIGSKVFTESYILAELMAQLLESEGFRVERKIGLGGTLIAWKALLSGGIDIYPEYTGTISHAILKETQLNSILEINRFLQKKGEVEALESFGFENNYALSVRKDIAEKYQLKTIEDLKNKSVKFGFSFEFAKREDGWEGLRKAYDISLQHVSMDHALAYLALKNRTLDGIEVSTTDPKIEIMKLVTLKDTRGFFLQYKALPLIRRDLPLRAKKALERLDNVITEKEMIGLNFRREVTKESVAKVAEDFLLSKGIIKKSAKTDNWWKKFWQRVKRHLFLTFSAVLFAILLTFPLAFALLKAPLVAKVILSLCGLLQTIPSIALLAFMIGLFRGIGVKPAIAALFIYSLLPILRNTYVALSGVDKSLIEVSKGMGLNRWQILRYVRLPMAFPVILAGVRTATVISIGTATLAAFIGAGGLGEPIVIGLQLVDFGIMLEGALPAAIMAILADLLFELLEKHWSWQNKVDNSF